MKICPKCGAEADGVFCINCGAPVNESPAAPAAPADKPAEPAPTYTPPAPPTYQAPQQPYPTPPAQPYGYQPPQPYGYYPPQQPTEEPVSVGGWIGRSLIPCIPFVGTIIYLIMLFVWMGDKTKQETFRNWAKAQLIVMGIVLGLVILLIIFSAALGVSIAETMYY